MMSISRSYSLPFSFFKGQFLLFVFLIASGGLVFAQGVEPVSGIGRTGGPSASETEHTPRERSAYEVPSWPEIDDADDPYICVPTYKVTVAETVAEKPDDTALADDKAFSLPELKEQFPRKHILPAERFIAPDLAEPKGIFDRSGVGFSLSKKQIIDGLSSDDAEPFRFPYGEAFDDDNEHPMPRERFHWKPAIEQSLMFLGVQHGYALIFQEKTRRALKGPFFRDYWHSIKGTSGWDDGNRFFTNYIAHPMQGGLTGFIYVQNHDRLRRQVFAESRQYWRDRAKAFVWSAAWSTQFELGPISQSSIGNVGMYGKMGYVDLVITPTVGTAWLVSEEAIDRYLIRHVETRAFLLKVTLRIFLNPMRTMANVLRFREPWYRDRPFGH